MSGNVAPAYVRHKPEQTLLYQLLEQYWPEFQTQLSETGHFLPRHVMREFAEKYCRIWKPQAVPYRQAQQRVLLEHARRR